MTRLRMGLASTMHPELSRFDDFRRLEALVGHLDARRSYEMGGIPASFAQSVAWPDQLLKVASCWSFKPDLAAFARGDLDDAFRLFLASIPARHRMWMCCWHEPEDDIAAGTITLADWTAANVHMAEMIHASTRANLHSVICLMGYTANPVAKLRMDDYRTAAEAVDLLAIDCYGESYWDPMGDSQAWRWHDWSLTVARPLGRGSLKCSIWETSAQPQQPGFSTYLDGLAAYAAHNGFTHFLGFNSTVGGSNPIVDGPQGSQPFADIVARYASH
jgi:hypothetical protein